ncbi:MAG TPA: diaminopimelate epimerase [Bacteroidota bacterium]|nr:diaminopimelate epimerase [Bacteroidota bacterium]
MNTPIAFTKASGAGNDFVLVNNFGGDLHVDFSRLARAACDRHFGIGGDGLLVIEKSAKADFTMLYYNADGSYGGMCGNGGRCIARFALLEGIAGRSQRFEALDHLYEAEVGETTVRLRMKDPAGIRKELSISAGGRDFTGTFVDTGAPHVVIFQRELENLDVMNLGREIRQDPLFSPEGTNVNFARMQSGSTVEIRTYERGVESETLACGTGSVASALVASALHSIPAPVTVRVRSGEQLLVHFRKSGSTWTDVSLEGSAHILFQGTMLYHPDKSIIRLTP